MILRHFGRNVIASILNVDEQDPKIDVLFPKIYDVIIFNNCYTDTFDLL